MDMPTTPVRYLTTVLYPGQTDATLDDLIDRIAQVNKGVWTSSGYHFASKERTIEYRFGKEKDAREFGSEATSIRREIMTCRVRIK